MSVNNLHKHPSINALLTRQKAQDYGIIQAIGLLLGLTISVLKMCAIYVKFRHDMIQAILRLSMWLD